MNTGWQCAWCDCFNFFYYSYCANCNRERVPEYTLEEQEETADE